MILQTTKTHHRLESCRRIYGQNDDWSEWQTDYMEPAKYSIEIGDVCSALRIANDIGRGEKCYRVVTESETITTLE